MVIRPDVDPATLVPGEATCNGHTVFICRAAKPGYLIGDDRTGVMRHFDALDEWRAS